MPSRSCDLALLAFGVDLALVLLHHLLEVLRDVGDQRLGGGPRFVLGLAHDDVDAQAEAQRAPDGGGAFAHLGDALADHLERLAPEQVDVGLFGADLLRRVRGAAEVERRAGLLVRPREDDAAFDPVVLAFVVQRFGSVHALRTTCMNSCVRA